MPRSDVLVVGGGVAGMAAAQSLARAGVQVYLVERERALGGRALEYGCKATESCNRCNVCLTHARIKEVQANPGITVLTSGSLESVARGTNGKGGFTCRIVQTGPSGGPIHFDLEPAAIILATGFEPFDARKRANLGYGLYPNVLTNLDLERAILGGGRLEKRLGRAPQRVAFIQCVGSRDLQLEHEYCSRFCCMAALRMARVLRQQFPAAELTLFYMDFQVGGKEGARIREEFAADPLVSFIRSMPSKVYPAADGRVETRYEDPGTGKVVSQAYDIIVLSTGISPAPGAAELAAMLGVGLSPEGFFASADAIDSTVAAAEGVFLAGCAQGPRDISESIAHGLEAAARAIEFLQLPVPHAENRTVLVLGAGSAGVEAAQTITRLGLTAVLADEAAIGGEGIPAGVEFINGSLVALEGQAGAFWARFQTPAGLVEREAGAVIVATGAGLVLPLDAYGVEPGPDTVPLAALQDTAARVGARAVAIWLDAFREDARPTFARALRAAIAQRELGREVTVLCRDAKVAGPGLERLYGEARQKGVLFVKYAGRPELERQGGRLVIRAEDPTLVGLAGVRLELAVDVLALAEKIIPPAGTERLARVLGVNLGPEEFFQEDNVHLLPTASNRRGITFAGPCRGRLDLGETLSDARIAAIRVYELLHGETLAADWPTAEVDGDKCAFCLTCYRTCPHGAVEMDRENECTRINRLACQGCGTCAGECPVKAIQLERFTDRQILAQIAG